MIKSKIALSLLLLSASISATGCQNASANASNTNFSDIGGHWAEATINKAISSGYVDGYPDGTFKPDASISRAEFIKMVATATGTKPSAVQGNTWYQSYVDSLKQQKVLRDSDFTDYNGELTRLELTKLAVREIRDDVRDPNAFLNDTGYFYDAVKVGLVQGLAGGELGMDQPTTRAQSLTIIERIKALKGGEKLEVDKYALGNAEILLKKTNMFTVAPEIFGKRPYKGFGWDPSNMFIESSDGLYRGELDSLIVIDLADPNDPHRDLLPDFDNLRWQAADYKTNPYIKDYPDSYVIVLKTHTEFNKDTEKYGAQLLYTLSGWRSPNPEAFYKGGLNRPATVYRNIPGDMRVIIMPKTGFTQTDEIDLELIVPSHTRTPENKTVFKIMLGYN